MDGAISALAGCYALADDLGHYISLWDQPFVSRRGCGKAFGAPEQVADFADIGAHLIAVAADALLERGDLSRDGRAILVRLAPDFAGTFAELLGIAMAIGDPQA